MKTAQKCSSVLHILVYTVLALVCIAPLGVLGQQSASLSLSPSVGTFPVGEVFTVEVRIHTGGVAVGTADATIAYNTNDLSYVGLSDEGSVFSNIMIDTTRTTGEIDLSAFIERGRSPYIGENGLIAKMSFLPLRNTATQIRFAKGGATPPLTLGASVGSMANILASLETATYSFVPKERLPANVSATLGGDDFEITPLPALVGDWFGTSTVRLSWENPSGALRLKTALSQEKVIPADVSASGLTNTVTLENVPEGKQYFLLQFEYATGWGNVYTYPVQVDTTPPSYITIKEVSRSDPTDPRVAFSIQATDALSGISHYMMSFDGEDEVRWEPTESDVFKPEGLTPGEHVLTVQAHDRAGNSASEETVFLVRSLESPTLINESVPERVLVGDTVSVRGTTYPDATVTAYISFNEGEANERTVQSDEGGTFVVTVTEGARAGKYTIWFTVKDARGAESPISIRRTIEVSQPYIMLFGSIAVTYLSVLVPLIGLILLLALVIWLGYTWARGYRGRVKRETNEAYQSARDEFESLRRELVKQIGMLEKANLSRELTREEMRIFTDISKRLDTIERHITQEIEDIEHVEDKGTTTSGEEAVHSVEGALEGYREKLKQSESIVSDSHVVRL